LQYGGTANTLAAQGKQFGINYTNRELLFLINTYKTVNKKIVDYWGKLFYTLKKCISDKKDCFIFEYMEDFVLMKYPSGRKIGFYKPRISGNNIFYSTSKGEMKFYEGGKIFNYLVQGTARDLLVDCMDNIIDKVAFTVHDEVIIDGRLHYETVKKCMEERKDYLQDCELIAEGEVCDYYRKF